MVLINVSVIADDGGDDDEAWDNNDSSPCTTVRVLGEWARGRGGLGGAQKSN